MTKFIRYGDQTIDVEKQLFEISKAECEESLAEFVRQAWHIIEPGTPLKWNWHMQTICDHLEAISRGELHPRLIINIPPRCGKSSITSVAFPAWTDRKSVV